MIQSVNDKVEQDKIKSNIYEFGNIISSYERTIKRPRNPKDETEQEYKNKSWAVPIEFSYGKVK